MRYTQILNGKAHWIFESDTVPQFAENIKLIDITNNVDVSEGWDFDSSTGIFTEPNTEMVTSQVSLEQKVEILEVSQAATDTTLLELMESLLQ